MLTVPADPLIGITMPADPLIGIIYLLHFTRAYQHARHYTGWTPDLARRLAAHRHGQGARLITVILAAGIDFQLARTCLGTRADERAIKNAGGATRYCPLCVPRPWTGHWGDDLSSLLRDCIGGGYR